MQNLDQTPASVQSLGRFLETTTCRYPQMGPTLQQGLPQSAGLEHRGHSRSTALSKDFLEQPKLQPKGSSVHGTTKNYHLTGSQLCLLPMTVSA